MQFYGPKEIKQDSNPAGGGGGGGGGGGEGLGKAPLSNRQYKSFNCNS